MSIELEGEWDELVPTPKLKNLIDKVTQQLNERAGVGKFTIWTICKSWKFISALRPSDNYFFQLDGVNGKTNYKSSAQLLYIPGKTKNINFLDNYWSNPRLIDRGRKPTRKREGFGFGQQKKKGWVEIVSSNVQGYINKILPQLNERSNESKINKMKVHKAWEYIHGSNWIEGSDYFVHLLGSEGDKYSLKFKVTRNKNSCVCVDFLSNGFISPILKVKEFQKIQKAELFQSYEENTNGIRQEFHHPNSNQ